jgi:carbonic anhydrase
LFALLSSKHRQKSAKTIGIVVHDDPFTAIHGLSIRKQKRKNPNFLLLMHKKAESTMIIGNEVEIVQWLPFSRCFFMFPKVKCTPPTKDNKENIGLGWKARALSTAPFHFSSV